MLILSSTTMDKEEILREITEKYLGSEEFNGYPLYERWKRTIIGHEGVDLLLTQVEFY